MAGLSMEAVAERLAEYGWKPHRDSLAQQNLARASSHWYMHGTQRGTVSSNSRFRTVPFQQGSASLSVDLASAQQPGSLVAMYIYIYIYIHTYLYVYICVSLSLSLYMYIYIYIIHIHIICIYTHTHYNILSYDMRVLNLLPPCAAGCISTPIFLSGTLLMRHQTGLPAKNKQ